MQILPLFQKQLQTAAAEAMRTKAVREEAPETTPYAAASSVALEVRAPVVEHDEEQHPTQNPTQPPQQHSWLGAAEVQHARRGWRRRC